MKRFSLILMVLLLSASVVFAGGKKEEAAPAAAAAPAAKATTIEFWHLDTTDDQQAAWREIADNFEASHPGVIINITCLENQAFKDKVAVVVQSGNPPDIFRSWGGGVMIEYAEAGMLKDITAACKTGNISQIGAGAMGVYAYDGVQYGAPYSLGFVGLWYNKTVFADCGLTEADFATWSKFLDSCKVLKSKGYAPISVGEAENWTGHYWFTYIAQRLGGEPDFLAAYNGTGAFNKGSFVKAMEMFKDLVDTNPFQDGFMANTQAEMDALVADRKAGVALMGQWCPSTGNDNSTMNYGDEWGVMPFPAIEGGAGKLTDVQGGGDGYVIGANAPAETVDFLKSFFEPENYKIICTRLNACPVVPGYEDLIDPNMVIVANTVKKSGYFQLYWDQFLPAAVGADVCSATEGIFAGTITPQAACDMIQASWEKNK